MAVQPFLPVPNTWRVVTRKHDAVNPTQLWTNTWAVVGPSTYVPAAGDPIFDAIANFEGFITYNTVTLQDQLVYPWQYGKNPAGPTPPVVVRVLNTVGEIPLVNTSPAWQGGGIAGSNVVCHVQLTRTSGPRNGKHFFRGVFEKADIMSPGAGESWALSNAGAPTTIPQVLDAEAVTQFATYLAGGTNTLNTHLAIVHAHKSGGIIVSAVTGLVSGVIFNDVTGLQRRRRRGT